MTTRAAAGKRIIAYVLVTGAFVWVAQGSIATAKRVDRNSQVIVDHQRELCAAVRTVTDAALAPNVITSDLTPDQARLRIAFNVTKADRKRVVDRKLKKVGC